MTSPTDDRLCRSFDYAAGVDSIGMARRDISAFVTRQFDANENGAGADVEWLVERLGLVVSELCTNAVEAAPGEWFRVDVTVSDTAGTADITCSVTNPHSSDDTRLLRFGDIPDATAHRGRGLVIVDGLADRTWVDRTPELTIVTSELSLTAER